MSNLAETLWAEADHVGALQLFRESLAGRRKVLGEDHPDSVATAEFLKRLETRLLAESPSTQPGR
jgi:hypothetical protein